MGPILEVHELTFRYAARPQPAIRDLSFALEEGEMAPGRARPVLQSCAMRNPSRGSAHRSTALRKRQRG